MANQISAYHHGDLRAALLAEATAMITEGGVASVTMRALGQRLGVSRAAAYRHFAGKTALLVAVAANGFDRLSDRLQATGADCKQSSGERLRHLGEEYVLFALENPAQYRLMYGKEALARNDLPELGKTAKALFDQFADVIRSHQQSGILKRQDPHALAYVAWSAVHGLASLVIEGQIQGTDDIDGLIRLTTKTVLDGMRVRSR
jgi:AcrR family transcriptional regulator